RALELGASVLVLEKGSAIDYPCNTRYSGGIVHVGFKDLTAPISDRHAALAPDAARDAATEHMSVLAEESDTALHWLADHGGRFESIGDFEFLRWVMAPARPRQPGLDWQGHGPDQLLQRLAHDVATAERGAISRGSKAHAISRGPNQRLTVHTEHAQTELAGGELVGTPEPVDAGAVVIADGGFQANLDLLREHIGPTPEHWLQRGAATGFGDGIKMAIALGAMTVGMDRFYGHVLAREALQDDRLWPYPIVDPVAEVSVVVDSSGHRVADEGMGGVHLANQLAKRDNPQDTSVVFDDDIWHSVAADNRYPPCLNPSFVETGGTVHQASTLARLAQALGINPTTLENTVARHNAAVDSGNWQGLQPMRTEGARPPHPIRMPPFRAIRLCVGITYTLGGIATDPNTRVRGVNGAPIPGLYAVGAAAGGYEGGVRARYVGGLIKALITGLRAGETAVADL
ncbi:MAG: FAD-binding protein, partial [Pseudomonadota bacterium]